MLLHWGRLKELATQCHSRKPDVNGVTAGASNVVRFARDKKAYFAEWEILQTWQPGGGSIYHRSLCRETIGIVLLVESVEKSVMTSHKGGGLLFYFG